MTSHHLKKQAGTWKWGLGALVLLAPFFFLTYGFANQYAASLDYVPTIMFDWEYSIPLWSWTIVPYWSIDLFYGLSLLLCWNKFELKQHFLRLFSAQIIAVFCFLIYPLKFSLQRPELEGFFGIWFDILMGFDQPFNQAPSLHIVLLIILWDFFRRHTSSYWKYIVDLWSLLIGLSVLTTWQHHFIDIPTGIMVGAFCLWLFPLNVKSPLQPSSQQLTAKHIKLSIFYLLGSIFLTFLALHYQGYLLWLLYPAFSLFLVAIAYLLRKSHFFQKQKNGDMSIGAFILFAPYIIFAWLNSRLWTYRHPQDSFILSYKNIDIFLGRIPSKKNTHNYLLLFDCCAEIPCSSKAKYEHYTTLDLIPVQQNQLNQAVDLFEQLIKENIHGNKSEKLLIFCALGYSRSTSILIAWLLKKQIFKTVNEALNAIKKARPWIVLNTQQIQELESFNDRIKILK